MATIKFITVKGNGDLAREPFYVGIPSTSARSPPARPTSSAPSTPATSRPPSAPYFVDANPTFAADGKSATFKVTGIPADTYSNAFIGVKLVDKNDPATTDSFRLPLITLVASGS